MSARSAEAPPGRPPAQPPAASLWVAAESGLSAQALQPQSRQLLPPSARATPPRPPADQMCLWCYHHILEEAAKESLPARCPNCRAEYDQEKIRISHIDAEQ